MRYSRSARCLVVSIILAQVSLHPVVAVETGEENPVAVRPTTFLLFNTQPGGTYDITKNSVPLATVTSSFFGVLVLNDVSQTGDRFLFVPSGVNPLPPSLPTGLIATGSDSTCTDITWNANPEGDITGYTLYFDTLSADLGAIVAHRDSIALGNVTSAHLCGFATGTYYFALRAKNAFGLLSSRTVEVTATVTSPVTQPPLPPAGVAVVESPPGCGVVSWQPGGEPNLAGYRLYYGTQSVALGSAAAYADSVDTGTAVSQTVCGLTAGNWYFAVRAYNTAGEFSAYSQEQVLSAIGADAVPPSVSLLAPTDGSVLFGAVTVSVSAGDNVGVVGVLLQLDGVGVGAEDTAAPFDFAVSSLSFGDGMHVLAAVARDAAGNATTSNAITIIVDNDAGLGHPSLLLSGGGLARLRAKACVDDSGNSLPACTPDPGWTSFESFISPYVSTGSYPGMRAWHFALVYKITKDVQYAQRALSIIDATIAGGMSAERVNDYEGVHEYARDAALVFDWLHPFLDAAHTNSIVGYVNQLLDEVFNPSTNAHNMWSGADVNDPGSYRFYRFLLAAGYAGLATAGDNPGPPLLPVAGVTYANITDFVLAKLDVQGVAGWLDTRGRGGAWHEGNEEGLAAKTAILDLFSVLNVAGRRNYFATTPFPRDAVREHLYSIQPGGLVKYPAGDAPADPTFAVGGSDRLAMLHAANSLVGNAEGEYAQMWLDTFSQPAQDPLMYPWEVILNDSSRPSSDFRVLSGSYVATGRGWVHSRSGWDPNAVALSFASGEHLQSEQHLDQNSFVIYRDGWQAADAVSFSSSGVAPGTAVHNTLLVDGVGQRSGAGAGTLEKYEFAPQYAYMVGDASDAYYNVDQKLLSTFQREIVHMLPGYVIVFDRVTAADSNSTVKYLLHTKAQPVVNGVEVTAVNGAGKIVQKTVVPANAIVNSVRELGGVSGLDSWRVEITPPSPSPNMMFLHVLYPAAVSATTMPAVSMVTTASNNMTGVRIDDGGDDIVVMFSNDPAGAPPTGGIIYDVSLNAKGEHWLTGLRPDTSYEIEIILGMSVRTIVVSEGSGPRTSRSGVLHFRIGDDTGRVAGLGRRR